MITVMGATGNTGRKITELLLEAGEEVRALVRSPEKLAELDALGAKTVAGDVRDATTWRAPSQAPTRSTRSLRSIRPCPITTPTRTDAARRSLRPSARAV